MQLKERRHAPRVSTERNTDVPDILSDGHTGTKKTAFAEVQTRFSKKINDVLLALQCCRTGYDFRKLGGDRRLTGTVIGNFQVFKQVVGVFAGLIHSGHPCTVL